MEERNFTNSQNKLAKEILRVCYNFKNRNKQRRKNMIVKLLNTTNPKFEYVIGLKGELVGCAEGRSPMFLYLQGLREKYIQTSVVMSMSLSEQIVTFNTINSVYTFEILGDLTCIEY
jgi:hypothetical protein